MVGAWTIEMPIDMPKKRPCKLSVGLKTHLANIVCIYIYQFKTLLNAHSDAPLIAKLVNTTHGDTYHIF